MFRSIDWQDLSCLWFFRLGVEGPIIDSVLNMIEESRHDYATSVIHLDQGIAPFKEVHMWISHGLEWELKQRASPIAKEKDVNLDAFFLPALSPSHYL